MKVNYFKLFYQLLGANLIYTLIIALLVSLLDSIGIGFFLGLAQFLFASEDSGATLKENGITSVLAHFGIAINSIRQLFIIGLIAFIAKSGLYYLLQIIHAKNTTGLIRRQRIHLISGLENVTYTAFLKLDFGRIHNVCTTEISKLNNALRYFLGGIQYFIMALAYLFISIALNYQISLIILFFTAIFYLLYIPIKKYYIRLSSQVSSAGNKYNSLLTQILNHFKYIKATHTFPVLSGEINQYINVTESGNFNILKGTAISDSIREPILLILLSLILIIYYSINQSISLLALFSLALFYRTINYIILTQNNFQQFNSYKASIDNITNLQNELEQHSEPITQGDKFSFEKDIQLKNIFLTLNNQQILKDINLEIPKNKTIGIVGQSGAGKTTLINVINGLIRQTSGSVMIDGIDTKSLDLAAMRAQIGYVSQDPVIFNDSLYNNITLWAEKSPENMQRFQSTIKTAHLDQLLKSYTEGEDTLLGEKGAILSGGQQQRVAIAREIFKSVKIIILDEATSSLDTQTENLIRENLEEIQGAYTLIIIAHRLSTIRKADQIYVIKQGTVVASGKYAELIEKSPDFRILAQQQLEN